LVCNNDGTVRTKGALKDPVSGKEKNAENEIKNESKRSKEIEDDRHGQGQEKQRVEASSAVQ
jgi:hypothetical protein